MLSLYVCILIDCSMSSILFELKEQVAIITLNRPEKLNSFNRDMALMMQKKLDDCISNEVRAVYITGVGKGLARDRTLLK